MNSVLIVDDEQRTIRAIQENVDWKRYSINKIFEANWIGDAKEIIEKEKIQFLICDIEMPNGTGLDLVAWIREKGYEINCIFVTCHPEFDYMKKAIQLQCSDYILKPIDYEELGEVLLKLIQKREELLMSGNAGKDISGMQLQGRIMKDIEQKYGEPSVEILVKSYIKNHITEDINSSEMAEALHFNPQYLNKSFKAQTGMNIKEFLIMVRMDRAKKILKETTVPIKKVADLVGYEDYSYFTRIFRKETGMSPKEYRLRNKK